MKLIYNVTINISDSKHDEWMSWMNEVHIPDMMKTGKFIENRFCKVLGDDPEGTTYSIQYVCENHKTLEAYMQEDAPALQQDHKDRFEGHFVSFRTLLKWME